jgi:UDP-3-O-[3-hydroxymyristoyl] glucosamine N-acyltransferase
VTTTVDELAALVGGRVAGGAGETRITGVAAIADAVEGQVTFLGDKKYLATLAVSKAAAAVVPADFAAEISAVQIRVENPAQAFAKILEKFAPPPVVFSPGVHPTAVIADGVKLGAGVSVQPHAVIEAGVSIGDGTFVGANVYIGHGTTIGADCKIHANVTIRERNILGNRVTVHSGTVIGGDGFGYEFSDGRNVKIPQTGIVQIDDDVEIGCNTAIDRARFGKTWIQQGTKIDNLVQIAHNVVIGRHCLIAGQVGIAGSTRLGNRVTLGGQAGLADHIEIGDGAMVSGGSSVSRSIPSREIWMGVPAAPMDEYKEEFSNLHRLSRLFARVKKLEQILDSMPKSSPKDS